MNLETNNDLIKFIENEKKQINTNSNEEIINIFYNCFIKTLIEINYKFKNIDNIKKNVYMGSNIMFNVFWIILNYSNNLTLTIFLSERSILLYSEFIILSRDPTINKDLSYIPNLSDAINFAYKKTIGPIEISDLSINKNNNIKNTCFLIKEIIQTIYLKYNDINLYKKNIENICEAILPLESLLEDETFFFKLLKNITNYINNNEISDLQKYLKQIITQKNSKNKILNLIY
jgi:hypothetical protein